MGSDSCIETVYRIIKKVVLGFKIDINEREREIMSSWNNDGTVDYILSI